MSRSVVQRFAVALLLAVGTVAVEAQFVSTHCDETEVSLSETYTVARLDRCGEDVAASLLWHLDRVDQVGPELDGWYERRSGGSGSTIYVMDTGVLASHAEFAGRNGTRVIGGYDATAAVDIGHSRCTSDDKSTAPCYDNYDELAAASHGTSVASIAAGRNIGVAPDAAVVSIRVMNERGLATTRTYLDGLEAIVRHANATASSRTAIVNISGWVLERLSSPSSDQRPVVTYAAVEKRMREMIAGTDTNGRRFLFVVAANNVDGGCGSSGVIDRFPALLGRTIDGMITVGGMTQNNTSWMGTCRGGVEVLAPAQGIFSASITAADHYRGRRPNQRNGTSFAAPIISGIAARLLSDRPELTPQQLEDWITATPSRVDNPDALLADGKVAYVRSIAPVTAASTRAALEP